MNRTAVLALLVAIVSGPIVSIHPPKLNIKIQKHGDATTLCCTITPPRGKNCSDFTTWFQWSNEGEEFLREIEGKYISEQKEKSTCTTRISYHSPLVGTSVCRCKANEGGPGPIFEARSVINELTSKTEGPIIAEIGDDVEVDCPIAEQGVAWLKVNSTKHWPEATLHLQSVTPHDSGFYSCQDGEHAVSTFELTVRPAWWIPGQNETSVQVHVGQNVSLDCGKTNAPSMLIWNIRSEELRASFLFPLPGKEDLRYSIRNVNETDAGTYVCKISNETTVFYRVVVVGTEPFPTFPTQNVSHLHWADFLKFGLPIVFIVMICFIWKMRRNKSNRGSAEKRHDNLKETQIGLSLEIMDTLESNGAPLCQRQTLK